MTFQQYIDNPLGKKNAVFHNREMYKTMYTEKFGAVNLREAGKVSYKLFHDEKNDAYYCYINIPSEVVPKFYYDVVAKFSTADNGLRTSNTLNDYDVQFYSNDPSFVFTYLRVFLKNGMFIEELKSKSPKLALRKDPVEKNPYEIPGYVKSLYFAFLYMKKYNLFSKSIYHNYGSNYSKRDLLNLITDADKKIADRSIEGEKIRKEKKVEKLKAQKEREASPTEPRKTVGNIRATKTVGKIGSIGSSKTVKSVKTVKRK